MHIDHTNESCLSISPLLSGGRYCSLPYRKVTLHNTFYPTAIRLLNAYKTRDSKRTYSPTLLSFSSFFCTKSLFGWNHLQSCIYCFYLHCICLIIDLPLCSFYYCFVVTKQSFCSALSEESKSYLFLLEFKLLIFHLIFSCTFIHSSSKLFVPYWGHGSAGAYPDHSFLFFLYLYFFDFIILPGNVCEF